MLGFGLARYLPAWARQWMLRVIAAVHAALWYSRYFAIVTWQKSKAPVSRWLRIERPRRPVRPEVPGGSIAIVGLFSSRSGIGQGARLMTHAFRASGRRVEALDVTPFLQLPMLRPQTDAQDFGAVAKMRVDQVVIHLNPPLYFDVYRALPRALKRSAQVVGYWAWELERVPDHWLQAAVFCDAIWVPSDFVADALRNSDTRGRLPPIRVVPHPVDAEPTALPRTPERRQDARRRHGVPPDAFAVGFTFSISSNYTRKNPLGAIRAFQMAFPHGGADKALFIVRCGDPNDYPTGLHELQRISADDPRIRLVLDDATTAQMPIGDLYGCIDVYLSLHRSEGYGLTLAEAARAGVPVITTGWGLAADLRRRPDIEAVGSRLIPVEDPQKVYSGMGARWAEPDVDEAARALRRHRDAWLKAAAAPLPSPSNLV